MKLKLLFFAGARDAAGTSAVEAEFADSRLTVEELRNRLAAEYPALDRYGSALLVAVNGEYVNDTAVLSADDEVAVFPPVSGG